MTRRFYLFILPSSPFWVVWFVGVFFACLFLSGLQFSTSRLWLPSIHLLTEITLQALKGGVGLSAEVGSGTQGDNLGSSCDSGYSSSCAPFTHIR